MAHDYPECELSAVQLVAFYPDFATVRAYVERNAENIVLSHDGTFDTLAPSHVDGYADVIRTYGTFTGWAGQ